MTDTNLDPTFKVITVGDTGAGKTCLILRIVQGFYPKTVTPTIGSCNYLKHISIDNKTILMGIIDTAGVEAFRSINRSYYRGCHAVLFVYDVCQSETLESISEWNFEVANNGKPVIKVLVGTKIDMQNRRKVPKEKGERAAQDLGFDFFVEVSSRTNDGVDNLFLDLAERLKRKHEEGLINGLPSNYQAVAPKPLARRGPNPAFKVITVGQCGTGKTSLLDRYINGFFPLSTTTTLGIEFKIKHQSLTGDIIMLKILDTAGQETFNAITANYYRNAHCVLLVYDVSDKESLDKISYWESEMKKFCNPALKVMVGNKCDKILNRQVSWEEGEKLSRIYGCQYFVEVSARTGFGVNELFLDISEHLMSDYESGLIKGLHENTANITVEEPPEESSLWKFWHWSWC